MEQIKMVIKEEKKDGRDLLVDFIRKYSNTFNIILNDEDMLSLMFLIDKDIVKLNTNFNLTYPIQAQVGWLLNKVKNLNTSEIKEFIQLKIEEDISNVGKYKAKERRLELEKNYSLILKNMFYYVVKK